MSRRGVQADEVWAAADALLAERVRPTIERVRMQLGRGSPNTIAPMLESWFATLGPRLGLVDQEPEREGVPEAVRQAMNAVWLAAQEGARTHLAAEMATEREQLVDQRTALQAAEAESARKQEALQQRTEALEESLVLARSQLADQAGQIERLQQDLRGRDKELASTRESLVNLVRDRDDERRRHEEQLQAHAHERERIQERAAGSERRHLEEVDRARQAAKDAQRNLAECERRLEAARSESDQVRQSLGKQAQDAQLENAALRERLAAAEQRGLDLLAQLQAFRYAPAPKPRKRVRPTKPAPA